MKIYETQEEVEKDVVNDKLIIDDDVTFECNINLSSVDIKAHDINAGDINVWNINAYDVKAYDINAYNINAWNINANDINAGDIIAGDIKAYDIIAGNIIAGNIKYYAFCFSYNNIECKSIEGTRDNHAKPICLDGKLINK